MNRDGYSNTELRILWVMKRNRGKISAEKVGNIYGYLANELTTSINTVRAALRELERGSVVIRHYTRPTAGFADGGGQNPLLAVELVDPRMDLPPVPPIPLAVVVARENAEMAERTAHEPTSTEMLGALVDRCLELQQQIDKLQEVVVKLSEENDRLHKRENHKPPEHLTSRVRDVLTAEQWEKMRQASS